MLRSFGGVIIFGVALTGCNLLTGADEFEVDGAAGGPSSDGSGGRVDGGAGGAGPVVTNGPGPTTSSSGDGGAGSTTTGSTTTGSTTTSSTTTTTTTTSSTGGGPMCPSPCGANEHCDLSTLTCVCDPGFLDQGGSCVGVDPGDPSLRTAAEVCDAWDEGHVITDFNPFSSSGADCDPGTLSQGGLDDTLRRINMFRWLAGLGPTSDDPGLNATNQYCANLEAWWNFSSGGNPHSPPSSSKCYTQQGAAGAGSSNIAWGNGPADSIDQYMEDWGNETTMGHRRWIVNPPLGPVGIGYWEGGGQYGSAQCLAVFGSSGNGPSPAWVAVPNQGFVPLTVARWTWTFHGKDGSIPNATVTVVRVSDNTTLQVQIRKLSQGFGQYAISWVPVGWQAAAGETYRVTIGNLNNGDVTYDVKPIGC